MYSVSDEEATTVSGSEELDIDLEKIAHDLAEDAERTWGRKKVPQGNIYEAARAGDCGRLQQLLEEGVDVNTRDRWDSVPLYYACLAGHLDAAKALLEAGAVCNEFTFDGDRCHYASLNLKVRRLLKAYEARPPPMDPLAKALREAYGEGTLGDDWQWPADVVFYVEGQPIRAHKAILAARSPYFRKAFATKWRTRTEIWLSSPRLRHAAVDALFQFFYSDRLDIAMGDMEALKLVARQCGCTALTEAVSRELLHQQYVEHKSLRKGGMEDEMSRLRFILQAVSMPEDQRLPHGMAELLEASTRRGRRRDRESGQIAESAGDVAHVGGVNDEGDLLEDWSHADVLFEVEGSKFWAHAVVLAMRSEYFRVLFGRTAGFKEGGTTRREREGGGAPFAEVVVRDCSAQAFEKLLEYIYTDVVTDVPLALAEELLDTACRYLLFPLKRATADAITPQLEDALPEDLCQWLILAERYSVTRLREYCINVMAQNFESFAATPEFLAMLASFPPPSGDSEVRTTAASAIGMEGGGYDAGNVLDDLREKWLEVEGGELEARDADALAFDTRLVEMQAKGRELLIESDT